MDSGGLKLFAPLLLLLPAIMSTVSRDDGQHARVQWCYRVCPNSSFYPSALGAGKPPPECLTLQCPTPVCPTPVCPTSPPPYACPRCPEQPPSWRSLPWKALKTYRSNSLGIYKFYEDLNLNWFDAQLHCVSEGAHLLILNSEEEDKFIRDEMRPGWIHIGIHHLFPDGNFTTVLGKQVSSTGFDKWLSGHSAHNISKNCGFINKSEPGIGMGLCGDKGRFVCEISYG